MVLLRFENAKLVLRIKGGIEMSTDLGTQDFVNYILLLANNLVFSGYSVYLKIW